MICDFLSASLTFPAELATPTALFQHNVESALWQRQAAHEPHPLKKLAFQMEAKKMTRYERGAVARFHHVIAVSENDRTLMSAMTDASRITVAPTGVDLSRYRAAAGHEATEPVVMFLGSMDWEANIDGVFYFHREIWSRIRAAVPRATFRIVGRNPSTRVRKLAEDPSVVVTGDVPSVVDHLRDAAVFVVPLRIGGALDPDLPRLLRTYAQGVRGAAARGAAAARSGAARSRSGQAWHLVWNIPAAVGVATAPSGMTTAG